MRKVLIWVLLVFLFMPSLFSVQKELGYTEFVIWLDNQLREFGWGNNRVEVETRLFEEKCLVDCYFDFRCYLTEGATLVAVGNIVGICGNLPDYIWMRQTIKPVKAKPYRVIFTQFSEFVAWIYVKDCRRTLWIKDNEEAGTFISEHLHFTKR